MKKGEGRTRKERSDKKRAINPRITSEFKELICRVSFICDRPLKDIGEMICEQGLKTKSVIEQLAPKFKRDYVFLNDTETIFLGNADLPLQRIESTSDDYRLNMRFRKEVYEQIAALAYSLDLNKSHSTFLLLETGLKDNRVFGYLLVDTVKTELDHQRWEQLKKVLREINLAEMKSENIPMGTLLHYLLEKYDGLRRIKNVVEEWLKR